MRHLKRSSIILFSLLLVLVLTISACAAAQNTTGFTDIEDTAWYAEAVRYCQENYFMNGISETHFNPEETLTRAQLVTILWRQEGEPAVTGDDNFTDTDSGQWYSNAIIWASQQRIVNGYGNGLFGINDSVTQEHLSLIFQRFTDVPVTEGIPYFTGNNIPATRAQAAAVLMAYAQSKNQQSALNDTPSTENKTLIAYFSNTGNTETIAKHISAITGGTLYEIVPEIPYSSSDLNYNDNNSRANREQRDSTARPAISSNMDNIAQYDIIFLGYPIWHGQAPKIISTFLESYDWNGKTIVPFCTSGSSPISSSAENLHSLASLANWLDGNRFSGSETQENVKSWIDTLELPHTSFQK